MAKTHGKNSEFQVGAADLSDWTTNVEWPQEGDTAETSAFGTQDRTYVRGLNGSTISASGQYDAATGGPDVTLQVLLNDETTTIVEYRPDGTGADKIEYSADAFLTSYSVTSELGGVVGWSAEWQVSGAVTRTVQI